MENLKPISSTELEPLAEGLAQTFIQRLDMHPCQLDDGNYICVKEPLTQNHILAHLRGDITIGVYLLNPDIQARFIVIDADDQDQMTGLMSMARNLVSHGLPSYPERCRRGGRLWLFFEEPIPGKDARIFGKGLLADHDILAEIKLYPKQDEPKNEPGSLIRLPFGIHRWDMKRYGFITPYGQPLASRIRDQIPLFFDPKTVSEAAFDRYWRIAQPEHQTPEFAPTEATGETLSQSIKEVVTVLDFVGQYVELTPGGRGHCPFHDDNHKSFSVNAEQDYWHCFAGCGGSSVIDFWMKYQGDDFKTVVGDLAGMLLV